MIAFWLCDTVNGSMACFRFASHRWLGRDGLRQSIRPLAGAFRPWALMEISAPAGPDYFLGFKEPYHLPGLRQADSRFRHPFGRLCTALESLDTSLHYCLRPRRPAEPGPPPAPAPGSGNRGAEGSSTGYTAGQNPAGPDVAPPPCRRYAPTAAAPSTSG